MCYALCWIGLDCKVRPLQKVEEWLRAEHAAALADFWALLSEGCDIATATRWAQVVEWTGISSFQSYKASDALVYSKSWEVNWGSFCYCSAYLMISILFVQAKSLSLPQIIEMTLLKQSLLLPLPWSILLSIRCTVCDNIVHLEGWIYRCTSPAMQSCKAWWQRKDISRLYCTVEGGWAGSGTWRKI